MKMSWFESYGRRRDYMEEIKPRDIEKEKAGRIKQRKINKLKKQHSSRKALDDAIMKLLPAGSPLDPLLSDSLRRELNFEANKIRVRHNSPLPGKINAYAFTYGNDIVLGKNAPPKGTKKYNELIAHEATHVVQQSGKQNLIQRKVKDEKKDINQGKYEYFYRKFLFVKPFLSDADYDANVRKYASDFWAESLYEIGKPAGIVPGIIEGLWNTLVAVKDVIVLAGKIFWAQAKNTWRHI